MVDRMNLGSYRHAFFGREEELADIKRMLANGQRLITVVAPGGYGKSRTIAELYLNLLEEYDDGVYEVPLAPVGDHRRIASVTADVLGLQFHGQAGTDEQLLDFLREKELLLCFDNFEHLIEGAPLLGDILETAAHVKIIVTSREILHLPGEHVFQLGPLPVEGSTIYSIEEQHSSAVLLFADRAAKVQPDFTLASDITPFVTDICSALSGVPLAIELAAAWVDRFSLTELKKEMSEQLDLTSRMDDVPERHRSVRASCDWSYRLLDEDQRLILRCISTFKGGFYLDAGQAVIPVKDLQGKLNALATKSWLYIREVSGKTRYFIHDAAIREYAFRKLLESDDFEVIVLAHCRYFAKLIEQKGNQLHSEKQLEAIQLLGLELENIHEALDTSIRRDNAELLLPFARHLHEYLAMVGESQDALGIYELILSKATGLGNMEIQQHAYLGLSNAHMQLAQFNDSRRSCLFARDIAEQRGDQHGLALACNNLGDIERLEGNHPVAKSLYNKCIDIMRGIDGRYGIASALYGLGRVEHIEGDTQSAKKNFEQSLEIMREIGDRHGIAHCLNSLGNLEYRQGNYPAARSLITESLDIRRGLGDRYGIAQSLNSLGNVEFSECNYSAAWTLYSESLTIRREIGERFGIAASLNNLGNVEYCKGNYTDARSVHAEGLAIKRDLGDRNGISFSQNNLGNISIKLQDYTRAQEELHEALDIARDINSQEGMLAPLAVGSALFAVVERFHDCGILCFGALAQAEKHSFAFDPMDGGMLEEGRARLMKALSATEVEEIRQTASAMSLDELVEYAMKELSALGIAASA